MIPLSLSAVLIYLTYIFFSTSIGHVVQAQKFRPTPVYSACSAFQEGRGLYIFGGISQFDNTDQGFMIDLSVSWNTDDPVFKKLSNWSAYPICTMLSKGATILSMGGSYDVKSNLWTSAVKGFVPLNQMGLGMTTDPGSGLVYVIYSPNEYNKYAGGVTEVNMSKGTVSTSPIPFSTLNNVTTFVWNTPLHGVLVLTERTDLYVFTPSEAKGASHGWKVLKTTNTPRIALNPCFVPAYGGSKMVMFDGFYLSILDVGTLTWTTPVSVPETSSEGIVNSACAVSGDYVVIWGGQGVGMSAIDHVSNLTYVYSMKSEAWTSRYYSPSDPTQPTTTTTTTTTAPSKTPTLQPTNIPDPTSRFPGVSRRVINIGIGAGVLVVVVLTAVSVYLGYKIRQMSDAHNAGSNGPVSDSLDADADKAHVMPKRSHHLRDPSSDPMGAAIQEGRLQQGFVDTQCIPEQHPHAVVDRAMK